MGERRCGVFGRRTAWLDEEFLCASVAVAYDAFKLLEMVDVVAGHGFYDGPEGHGAALGMGGGAMAFVAGDGCEEEKIPVAHCLEESERGLDGVDGVAVAPGFLIEGLDDVVGLVWRGGEGLAETESKDGFGVGEVGDDVRDAPLTGGGWGVELRVGEAGGESVEAPGGAGEDGERVLAVKVFCVGV
jgi:hypothetical protein